MHSHDGDIMLHGFHHRALHIVLIRQAPQLMEYQRMMAHNEVAAIGYGLIDNILSNVKTQ